MKSFRSRRPAASSSDLTCSAAGCWPLSQAIMAQASRTRSSILLRAPLLPTLGFLFLAHEIHDIHISQGTLEGLNRLERGMPKLQCPELQRLVNRFLNSDAATRGQT